LRRITPHLQDDGKALPQRPESGSFKEDDFSPPDDEDEAYIETAIATRIVNDQSYDPDLPSGRTIQSSQLPIRRESLMPSALDSGQYKGNNSLEPSIERSQSKSPMKQRVQELKIELPPAMESIYMPPPLSPRRPQSPVTQGSPNNSRERPHDPYKTNHSLSAAPSGHTRVPSNESMSWLDTIDESGGSAASSVHSRTSSMGVRRKRIRAASGATEAEFDAALDAAVEAAYDEGFEPMDGSQGNTYHFGHDAEDDDDDAIVANVRRKVELAKERVRQSEREAVILEARDRERQRLLAQNPEGSHGDGYGNESDEEERMLEEMTREYVMDDFEFGLQSKSALPRERESDSSGFSGRTSGWNSSIGSNPTTAGTMLSTVTESSFIPQIPMLQTKATHPPPAQALPPPPPGVAVSQATGPVAQGVRSRRLSGQNPKQLKIETTVKPSGSHTDSPSQPPSIPPPKVPDINGAILTHPKTAGLPPKQPLTSSRPPLTISNRQASSSFPALSPSEVISPPKMIPDDMDQDGVPRSGSPGRAPSRGGLRKNFSSSSLKAMKTRNMSVSAGIDDGSEISPHTPGSSQFMSRENGRLPTMPTLPTPIAAAFTNKMNAPTGGMYLFSSDIHSPESPGSPNPLSTGAPIPLEPCPTEFLLRPFWLMRALYQTIAHPRGGYLSTKLFVPRDVWRVKGVKIKNVEDKIANCDFLTAALLKLARVDAIDADAVLEEMQALEGVLEQVQTILAKKLGNDVGVPNPGGMFKDPFPGGDTDPTTTSSKAGSASSKASSFSWRRLRSKNSGVALSSAYANKAPPPELPKDGLTMGTLPMTSTALAKVRFAKKDLSEVQFSGPNAQYMSSLARLFDAAQAIGMLW
jgi:hypothetical protein